MQGRGSIPACAGEPSAASGMVAPPRVYPRVCGGTVRELLPAVPLRGLSPRVRGNPLRFALPGASIRSIPACAGEPDRAHQRRREQQGLSPRVRGNRLKARHTWYYERSIPACAGEPDGRDRIDGLRQVSQRSIPACAREPHAPRVHLDERLVYPRVCGGTALLLCGKGCAAGLSPRVRGNPAQFR